MTTREAYLSFALTLESVYTDMPFHDDNWVLLRHTDSKKTFAFTFMRQGHLWVNLKFPPDWREFFRMVYPSCLPAYHMNKEHWSSVILDGSIPDEELMRMTRMSHEMTLPKKAGNGKKAHIAGS